MVNSQTYKTILDKLKTVKHACIKGDYKTATILAVEITGEHHKDLLNLLEATVKVCEEKEKEKRNASN